MYGERHARNTLIAFFLGIGGMIIPVVIGAIFLMFLELVEDIYIVIPFFIHMVPVCLIFATYLFVKDIGGRKRGLTGLIIFTVSSFLLSLHELGGLIDLLDNDPNESFLSILMLSAMFMAIAAMVGVIFMIVAFVDASRWTKTHKPLLDTQQKQQLEMQQNQIKMQIEQLEMQKEQLEMQKRSLEMLTDISQDSLEEGEREMISDRVGDHPEEYG